MVGVLAKSEDKIRGYIYSRMKAALAPHMAENPCDGSETVSTTEFSPPSGVLVTWERIEFDNTTCDFGGRTSAQAWEWKALARWDCRVSVGHYLDKLTEEPFSIDGDRNLQGRMISPRTVLYLSSAELEDRPAQGAEIGPGLVLTFTVSNKK